MAIASDEMARNVRKTGLSSRSRALMSIVGVIGGSVLFFKYLKGGQEIAKPEERIAWQGGNIDPGAQTDQGTIKSSPRVKLPTRNT